MIDIIIPAYNAHEYINNALISIAMQTIKDSVNVYIVNDASNKDYSESINIFKDKLNIKEIDLDVNSGPGVARQKGIDLSNNEYILFLDSDDLLYNAFSLEKLYNSINGYDMVVGAILDEQGKALYYYSNHTGCLHGKMYKRKYLEKYNIRFNDSRSSEDNSFNQLCLLSEPNISYIEDVVYLYKYNNKSLTNSLLDIDNIKWYIYNIEWTVDRAVKEKFNPKLISEYVFNAVLYIYGIYVNNIENKRISIIPSIAHNLVNLNEQYIKYLSKKEQNTIYYKVEYVCIPDISLKEFYEICKKA